MRGAIGGRSAVPSSALHTRRSGGCPLLPYAFGDRRISGRGDPFGRLRRGRSDFGNDVRGRRSGNHRRRRRLDGNDGRRRDRRSRLGRQRSDGHDRRRKAAPGADHGGRPEPGDERACRQACRHPNAVGATHRGAVGKGAYAVGGSESEKRRRTGSVVRQIPHWTPRESAFRHLYHRHGNDAEGRAFQIVGPLRSIAEGDPTAVGKERGHGCDWYPPPMHFVSGRIRPPASASHGARSRGRDPQACCR